MNKFNALHNKYILVLMRVYQKQALQKCTSHHLSNQKQPKESTKFIEVQCMSSEMVDDRNRSCDGWHESTIMK